MEEMKGRFDRLEKKQDVPSGFETSTRFKDLPKAHPRNPWRQSEGFIQKGEFLLKLDGSFSYPLNKLDWHPSVNHIDAVFRVREEAIPCPGVSTAVEVLIQTSDALMKLDSFLNGIGFTKFETSTKASSSLTFVASDDN